MQAAPEVVLGVELSPAADIYSYGVVLYEVCGAFIILLALPALQALSMSYALDPEPCYGSWSLARNTLCLACSVLQSWERLWLTGVDRRAAKKEYAATCEVGLNLLSHLHGAFN